MLRPEDRARISAEVCSAIPFFSAGLRSAQIDRRRRGCTPACPANPGSLPGYAGVVTLQENPARHSTEIGDEGNDVSALFDDIYGELRRLAQRYMHRERPGHMLQATALVHEAFLRLAQGKRREYRDQRHFRATAARVIRHVLVNHAVAQRTKKRNANRVTLHDSFAITKSKQLDMIALDEALSRLASVDERQCRIVEMRFFGGLTLAEIAEELSIGTRTVSSDWALAKAWLALHLEEG